MDHRGLRAGSILAVLCLLVLQAGCAFRITPTPEPASITFACDPEGREYYEPLIEAFNRERGHISIELVTPPRFDWPDADVWAVSPFTRRFMLQEEVQTLDLRPFVERGDPYGVKDAAFKFDREDFSPGMLGLFEDDAGIWAVPYAIYVQVMYYNRDLFDRYGVAYPQIGWTWDDFVRAGQALYRPWDGIYGYTPDRQKNDPISFIYQNGGRIFDDLNTPTRTTFDDPLTIEALDWYAGLMYEKGAAATPLQAIEAYGISGPNATGIQQGRLGMWTGDLTREGGGLEGQELEINWGVAPLPTGRQPAAFAFALGYVISARAQSPDACWEWIVYLSHQPPPEGIPVRKSVLASEAFEEEVGEAVAAVARTAIEHALFLGPEAWDIYGEFQTFNEALNKLYGGEMTASQAMQWAQENSSFR
jgi:ABC-type glycerol-3-phosphate transport system substrate-binding protein